MTHVLNSPDMMFIERMVKRTNGKEDYPGISTATAGIHQKIKKGCGITRNPLIFMVGGTGIEPVTSTV
jgi:hypothetical protein